MKVNYTKELNEYIENLWNKDIGKEARDFLKKRNITANTAREWDIGYCPIDYIPKCFKETDYPTYVKMQGRVIFPVYDSNGDLLTLSGRAIRDDLKPKYMHYSFPTGRTLFGLYKNEKDIIKNNAVFFTEGQIDTISAWQNGFRLCACTFGSHFSEEQILLASRYTKRVYILFDGDDAGIDGAKISYDKIKIKGDMNIKILSNILKNDEDLDDWIKHNDVNYFNKFIRELTKEEILKYKLNLQKKQ